MVKWNNQAELIKKYRGIRDVSQTELSRAMGLHPQSASNFERALCGVPFKHLRTLKEFLHIPTHELRHAIKRDFENDLDVYLGAMDVPLHLTICPGEELA